jgi:hypothetical protein
MNNNNLVQVAEKLYREMNPESKMDVPSFAYEIVEKWRIEWLQSNQDISLYDWIKQNKTLK